MRTKAATRPLATLILTLAWQVSGPTAAASGPPAKETPEQKLERLLAAAMKDPEKGDWRELRRAFAQTNLYHPYSNDVDEKLRRIARSIGAGELERSEAELRKLVERDRFMRFDSLAMLMMLEDKMGREEEAEKYGKLLGGIDRILMGPKRGTSFEDAIEVLFVEEEYLIIGKRSVKVQGLAAKDGHRFDVITLAADGDEPERDLYFNVDLLQDALGRDLIKK
jgi:hypothetical protein